MQYGKRIAHNVLGNKYIRVVFLLGPEIDMSVLVSIFQIYSWPCNECLKHTSAESLNPADH